MTEPVRQMRCSPGNHTVSSETYIYAAGACRACCQIAATTYGVDPDNAGFCFTAKKNLEGYFRDMPGAHKLSDREKVRILLLKTGIEISDPSNIELRCSAYLQTPNGQGREG